MAEALATALGGVATGPMPRSRYWGVEWTRPDGQFVSIESDGAYLYASEASYRALQSGGDFEQSPVIDGAEWGAWNDPDRARGLGRLLGGSWEAVGGGQWNALATRADGRFVVITPDCALIYESRESYLADDCGWIDCHNFYED